VSIATSDYVTASMFALIMGITNRIPRINSVVVSTAEWLRI
jgi:hypothetical protein